MRPWLWATKVTLPALIDVRLGRTYISPSWTSTVRAPAAAVPAVRLPIMFPLGMAVAPFRATGDRMTTVLVHGVFVRAIANAAADKISALKAARPIQMLPFCRRC